MTIAATAAGTLAFHLKSLGIAFGAHVRRSVCIVTVCHDRQHTQSPHNPAAMLLPFATWVINALSRLATDPWQQQQQGYEKLVCMFHELPHERVVSQCFVGLFVGPLGLIAVI